MRLIVTILALALLAGCAPASNAPAEKTGTGELRHDTAPLTDRFAQLDGLESASWMSGTFGDAPGPSLYWIDAVVVFSEGDYAELTDGLETKPATPSTELELPDGEFTTSALLNDQFSPDEYRTTVYLNDENTSLVILSVFE